MNWAPVHANAESQAVGFVVVMGLRARTTRFAKYSTDNRMMP
jgi:hypothetical protein